ncbi:MAG: hypothetical protein JXX28_18745 [Deltaproteobacteria bacterium]|nr:hypothetical protein [Deltaproteobacteria bacterium]
MVASTLFLALTLPAVAQDDGLLESIKAPIRVEARPQLDGLVRQGRWASIHLDLTNRGPAVQARITLSELDLNAAERLDFTRSVELPQGAEKEVELYWRPGNLMSTRGLTVSGLVDQELQLTVVPIGEDEVVIGVIGEDTLGIAAIRDAWAGVVPGKYPRSPSSEARRVHTVALPLDTLPERSMAYDPLDWVIWPHPDPTDVSPAALEALLAWVADGGHLMVAVADSWRQVADTPLAEALPVTLIGVEDLPLDVRSPGWRPSSTPITPTLSYALRPARSPWSSRHLSGVVGTWGAGTIHLLPVDPTVGPLASDRTEGLWRDLLGISDPSGETAALMLLAPPALQRSLGLTEDTYQQLSPPAGPSGWTREVSEWLEDIPGVSPLPMPWLLGFSLLYLVAIGPADWLLLRLLRRPALTWVTFPLTVLLFSSAALVGTWYFKGDQAVLRRLEVVEAGRDRWRGGSYLGVFAARKARVQVRSGFDDSVASPLADDRGYMTHPVITSGDGPAHLSWLAETWTLAKASTSWTAPSQGTATAQRGENGWVITSSLPFDLTEVSVVVADGSWRLERLPAGGTVAVDYGDTDGDAADELPSYDLSNPYPGAPHGIRGGPYLVGTAPGQVEALEVLGLSPQSYTLTLVRVPL